MSDAIVAFIEHGLSARWEDIPDTAQRAVRTFLLDTIGVGVAGAAADITRPVRKAAKDWGGGGTASVWGEGGWRTSAANAAFLNGFQIHCQEFDCVHEAAVVHPLATILSALMADAEARGRVTGRELGVALAVSVDLAAGLGVAVKSPIRFFRPANAGIFGATLGISRLRGFDAVRTRNAMGYALAFCSGTMQSHVEGKPALPVQIANAARGAVMACDLAEAGMEGPQDVLEGPYGYFRLFELDWDLAPVLESLGQVWRIAEVSHKPFPTGRAAQGGIVLMQKLRAHGIAPEQVDRIELTAPPLIARLVGRPLKEDMSANYARLCFQYSGSVAYRTGNVGLQDFSGEALADPDTAAFGGKIKVIDDGSTNPAAFVPQTARLFRKDGSVIEARVEALFGSPHDPLSTEQNEDKFRQCWTFGWRGQHSDLADQLVAKIKDFEKIQDVGELSRLAAGQES